MDDSNEYSDEFSEETKKKEEVLINETYNSYVCDSCGEELEIIDFDFNHNNIVFKCRNNEITNLDLNRYTQNEFNHVYYKSIYQDENNYKRTKKDFLESWVSSFKNFFNIYKILPLKNKDNKKNQNISSHQYNKYCKKCNHYYSDQDKNICKHIIESIPRVNNEDIKNIKDKIIFLIEQINNNIIFIKFLDILLKAYDENSINYYNCKNIINVSKCIINKNDFIFINKQENNKKIDNSIQIKEKLDSLKNKVLEQFNVKFKVNLTGEEIKINLSGKNICDLDLKKLCSGKFPYLKDLNLSHNQISNTEPLQDLNTNNLKKIDLSYNLIEKVNPLGKVFDKNQNLEVVLLNNNRIKEVESIKNNIPICLREINLDNNKIIQKEIDDIINKIKIDLIIYKPELNSSIRLFGQKFVQNNKNKCHIYINGTKSELIELYNKNENEEYVKVKLIITETLNDISYMFCDCCSLYSLPDISKWDININKISYMFSGCSLLKSLPNISEFDLEKVTNLSNLFNGCSSLLQLYICWMFFIIIITRYI